MHIAKFGTELDKDPSEDNINIPNEDKLQHYLEQMYNSDLFTLEKMNDYKDLDEVDRDYKSTVVLFEGLVEHMDRFTENNGSTAKANGFESAASIDERRGVDTIMNTLTIQIEVAEEENDHL